MDEHTLSKITKTYAKESPYQAGDFFVYILQGKETIICLWHNGIKCVA